MLNRANPIGRSPLAETGSNSPVQELDGAYLKILRMIENRTISAREGEMLLDALDASSDGTFAESRATIEEPQTWSPGPPDWVQWVWIYPLAGGVLLLGLAGITTAVLVSGGSHLGWLACSLPLMALGGLVLAVAWWSHSARWVHVRVRSQDTRFGFSLPVPLRLVAWLARVARPWVPRMQDYPVDELILGLAELGEQGGLRVEVNDKGEEIQVYVG